MSLALFLGSSAGFSYVIPEGPSAPSRSVSGSRSPMSARLEMYLASMSRTCSGGIAASGPATALSAASSASLAM